MQNFVNNITVHTLKKEKSTRLKKIFLEIKSRASYIFFSAALSFLVAYQKTTQLSYIFLLSFVNENGYGDIKKKFIFTDVSEAFSSTISICVLFCFFCLVPLLLYHFFCFLSPSWYVHERKKHRVKFNAIFFFLLCYIFLIQNVVIPELCTFLLKFQVHHESLNIAIEPKIKEYVSWVSNILGGSLFLFFLCILFYFIFAKKMKTSHAAKAISWKKDWGCRRKYIFWISLLVSSILSPPEIWNQLFLALLLFTLCELLFLSLLYTVFLHKQQKEKLELFM